MKYVYWKDERGIKHRSILKEGMLENRPQDGYLSDPPDVVHSINWRRVAIELQNALIDRELFTIQDVVNQQNGITGAILSVLKRQVKDLYRR